jgi:protein-S-isoprenylcysteine O-methyltransferase Ste14
MISRYQKWAQKEHSLDRRLKTLIPAGLILLILFPLAIAAGGPRLDARLGLPSFQFGLVNFISGGVLIVVGMFFGIWSNVAEITRGRGTPLPMMPTQELLIDGPFRYCRNPMTLGTLLAYSGIGIAAGTPAGLGIVVVFGSLLIAYLKFIEEKELAARFGEAYLAYKRSVPFMIPSFRRKPGVETSDDRASR